MSSAVVMEMTFRPPEMAIMNEFGIRRVAPARPAMAGRVYSCVEEKVNPRFCICTMMIDQYFPVRSQNTASSTFHSPTGVLVTSG